MKKTLISLFLLPTFLIPLSSKIIINITIENSVSHPTTETRTFSENPFYSYFIKKIAVNTIVSIGTAQGVFYLQYPKKIVGSTIALNQQGRTTTNVQGIIILDARGIPESFLTTTLSGRGWQFGSSFDKRTAFYFSFFNKNLYGGYTVGPFLEEIYDKVPSFYGNIGFGFNLIHTLLQDKKKLDAGMYNIAFGYSNNNDIFGGGIYNVVVGVANAIIKNGSSQSTLTNDLSYFGSRGGYSNYNIALGNELFQSDGRYYFSPCKQNIIIGNANGWNISNFLGNIIIGNNNFFSEKSGITFQDIENNIIIGSGIFCFYQDRTTKRDTLQRNIILYPGDITVNNDASESINDIRGYSIPSGTQDSLFLATLGSKRRAAPLQKKTFILGTKRRLWAEKIAPLLLWTTSDNMIGSYIPKLYSNGTGGFLNVLSENELNNIVTKELFNLPIIGVSLFGGKYYFIVDANIVATNKNDQFHYLCQNVIYDQSGNASAYESLHLVSLMIQAVKLLKNNIDILVAQRNSIATLLYSLSHEPIDEREEKNSIMVEIETIIADKQE